MTLPVGYARIFDKAEWQADAACKGHDPDMWFPIHGQGRIAMRAKEICKTCPVARQCLQFAIDGGDSDGIWGGVSMNAYRRRNWKTA